MYDDGITEAIGGGTTKFNDCEKFEPRSHFKSSLRLIVRVNVVLNRTVVVDSD